MALREVTADSPRSATFIGIIPDCRRESKDGIRGLTPADKSKTQRSDPDRSKALRQAQRAGQHPQSSKAKNKLGLK